jgi:hypothetical protein
MRKCPIGKTVEMAVFESVQTVVGKVVIRQAGTRKPGNSFTKVFWQGHKPSVSGSFGKRFGIRNMKQRH